MGKEIHTPNQFTRRSLFNRAALVGAAVGAGAMAESPSTPTNPEYTQPSKEITSENGARILLNDKALPIVCIFPDQTEYHFNALRVERMRQLALSTHEPQIIDMVRFPGKPDISSTQGDSFEGSQEHPLITELPKDILTEDQLRNKGIEVIQTDTTKLFVREGAFESDGPLDMYSRSGNKLTIVLVDAPVITQHAMNDNRYRNVSSRIPESYRQKTDKFRDDEARFFEQELTQYRKDKPAEDDIAMYGGLTIADNNFLHMKQMSRALTDKNVMTDEDLVRRMLREGHHGEALGLYAKPEVFAPTGVAYLSVGDPRLQTNVMNFYINSKGEFGAREIVSWGLAWNQTPSLPKASQTHPDPDQFWLNPAASPDNPKSYPYAGQSPGFVLRHEIAHADLITAPQSGVPNYSEYDTDMRAMDGIRRGWARWRDSDFRDDTGYPFVLTVRDGGYILT